MKVFAFDVDETLWLSRGPVTLDMIKELRDQGHIVGICGNMGVWCSFPDWHKYCSFIGQGMVPKHYFLHNLKQNIKADDYILVGNVFGALNSLGVLCMSPDSSEAQMAQWRFIKEDDFAAGVR